MVIRLAHLILILSPLWMWDIHPAIQFQGALRATCFYINQIHRSATMQWNWMSCDLFSTFADLQMKSSSLLRFLHHLPVQNKRSPQMLLPTFLASPISLVFIDFNQVLSASLNVPFFGVKFLWPRVVFQIITPQIHPNLVEGIENEAGFI